MSFGLERFFLDRLVLQYVDDAAPLILAIGDTATVIVDQKLVLYVYCTLFVVKFGHFLHFHLV